MADLFGLEASGLPPEMIAQLSGLQGNRAILDALLKQSLSPLEAPQTKGRIEAKINPISGIAKVLQAYMARQGLNENNQAMQGLAAQKQKLYADEMANYNTARMGTPAQMPTTPVDDDGNANPMVPATAADPRQMIAQALAANNPMVKQLGQLDYQTAIRSEDREDTQKFKAEQAREQRALVAAQKEADRVANIEKQRVAIEAKKEADAKHAETMMALKRAGLDSAEAIAASRTPGNKPLPPQALKMQQEALDAIGTASGINADMGAVDKQLEKGTLQLGPVENLISKGKNVAGLSDSNSRNFASLTSTLEKLRNDSLRLNKGVQTEGDAQRAWNELIANINDPDSVRQRIAEITAINERAASLRKREVDVVRMNYGHDPMDTSAFSNVPAAVGSRSSGLSFDADKERRYQEWKAKRK